MLHSYSILLHAFEAKGHLRPFAHLTLEGRRHQTNTCSDNIESSNWQRKFKVFHNLSDNGLKFYDPVDFQLVKNKSSEEFSEHIRESPPRNDE